MNCEKCGAELIPGSKFCENCGNKVEEKTVSFCPECGAKLEGKYGFCPSCGTALNPPQTEPLYKNYMDPAQNGGAAPTVNIPNVQPKPAQSKKKLGIIIGAAVALILVLVIVLVSCGGGSDSGSGSSGFGSGIVSNDGFDTSDATAFIVEDLTCYVPSDWEYDYDSSTEDYTVYTVGDDYDFAFIMVSGFYSGEDFDALSEQAAESFGGGFGDVYISWADNAIRNEVYDSADDYYTINYVCDVDGYCYAIVFGATDSYYDLDYFDDMVNSFELY